MRRRRNGTASMARIDFRMTEAHVWGVCHIMIQNPYELRHLASLLMSAFMNINLAV